MASHRFLKLILTCLYSCALFCGKVVAQVNVFIDGTIKKQQEQLCFLVDDSDHSKVDSSAIDPTTGKNFNI